MTAVLQTIYERFAEWASTRPAACAEGCATCCTLNVTATALEGRRILAYSLRKFGQEGLRELLAETAPRPRPRQTANEYVLTPGGAPADSTDPLGRCPFLERERCRIYPVRPFACRCFISEQPCSRKEPARVADDHLYGAMAAEQIIEHLGQFDLWGNMIDLLVVLSHRRIEGAGPLPGKVRQALENLRRAQPLPGFVYPKSAAAEVERLQGAIFSCIVAGKTVEQILNGR